jgi:hypothetical protein
LPLVPLRRRVLADLGYDGEHVWLQNLAAIVGRRRRKERGRDDAVEPSLFAARACIACRM